MSTPPVKLMTAALAAMMIVHSAPVRIAAAKGGTMVKSSMEYLLFQRKTGIERVDQAGK